jgi:hypothetical protein
LHSRTSCWSACHVQSQFRRRSAANFQRPAAGAAIVDNELRAISGQRVAQIVGAATPSSREELHAFLAGDHRIAADIGYRHQQRE